MEIIACDICKSIDKVNRKSYSVDRKMDAAGSMDTVSETFDLCTSCEYEILKRLSLKFKKMLGEYEVNTMIVSIIKEMIRKRLEEELR